MSGHAPGPDHETARPAQAGAQAPPPMAEVLDDLLADFEVLEDWTERYEYIIELGRDLPGFPDAARIEDNRLHGCQSQVWLLAEERDGRLFFEATSDSAIVAGLIAILLRFYNARTPREILDSDAGFVGALGLDSHLSPTRSTGLKAMLEAIRGHAARAAARGAPAEGDDSDGIDEVYGDEVMRLAGAVPRLGRLDSPDVTVNARSRVCGSSLTLDLQVDGDRVTDYAQQPEACALGRAACAIVAQHVVGKRADELRALRERMWAMLRDNGPPPEGEWADLGLFQRARFLKSRHGSIMLALDALDQAFGQLQGRRAQS